MLAFERLAGDGPESWVIFLHGILGRGANWRSFAKRLIERTPRWGAVLVDLRAHGDSRAEPGPHTVAAAATDLDAVAAAVGNVQRIVGHSFGGKVALQWLADRRGTFERAFIIDSTPGPRPDRRGSEETVAAVERLARVGRAGPYARRDAVVRALETEGVAAAMAQFLATNFERTADGRYALATDLDAIRALLDDYFALDLWPVVESPPGIARIDLVAGGRSNVLDDADRARARRAAAAHADRIAVHVVPDAGHWIHVDAPDALLEIVV